MKVKVRVLKDYKDKELNKMVKENYIMVVSRERADYLSAERGLVEVIDTVKEEVVETNKLEPKAEKAIRKTTTKRKTTKKKSK